jgi:hypothetical protein
MTSDPRELLSLESEEDTDFQEAIVAVAEELPDLQPKWGATI